MVNKVLYWIIGISVVLTVLFGSIEWLKEEERDKVIDEITIETLERQEETRQRVEEIINEVMESNPTRDGAIALDSLRNR